MTHMHERLLQQTIEHLQFNLGQMENRIRVLERENEELVQKLKDAGVVARVPSLGLDRLPVLLEAPDTVAVQAARAAMTQAERALLDRVCGPEEVMLLYQSETRTPVGLWMIDRVVWVAVTREAVIFLASGRRPLAQRVSFLHLYESLYNPVTGELVLGPDREYRVGQVRLPPLEGSQILAQIYGGLTPQKERSK
jgi:hypothetical protein